jgi:hypothetical protein
VGGSGRGAGGCHAFFFVLILARRTKRAPAGEPILQLHIVYRSTGKENLKPRPAYYSKLVCLLSLLRAVETYEGTVEIAYLTDGPIPPDQLELMNSSGSVIPASFDSVREACLGANSVPELRAWPDEDLVYFVEDDYLHLPESLVELIEAAKKASRASYFGTYGTILEPRTAVLPTARREWDVGHSTTHTFAVRLAAFRRDGWIYRLGGSLDRDICQSYRGFRPFRWGAVVDEFRGKTVPLAASGRRRRLSRLSFQVAMNLLATRRSLRPHLLIISYPSLATHLELPHVAPGVDWEKVAAETEEWAASRYSLA